MISERALKLLLLAFGLLTIGGLSLCIWALVALARFLYSL